MSTAIRKKPITRNRDTLTCQPCRAKKLKCDKSLPCGSCVKRNDKGSCTYAKTAGRKEIVEESRATKAEARLQHLESLVQSVLSGPDTSGASNNGHESIHDSPIRATYTGATHYTAMLEDIEELRQVLGEDELSTSSSPSAYETLSNETDVLFGCGPRLSLAAVIANHLPPKPEVDRRIAAYFRAEAIAAPFIHVPQFMRQYELFWSNQFGTHPLWISILFSICNLSQSTGRGAGVTRAIERSSATKSTTRNFSLAAAHCLTIGRYSRPQRFAVEALGVYIQSKVIENLDPSRDIGILFGTLIQLAYCQGYHRDSSHFKHLTPFEGEMRRRAWSYCMQLDLLNSFQLGLPNNVQFGSWNTKVPANLRDTDFDEDSNVLPPDRPFTDATKVSFYSAKHLLMTIFDKILRHALSATGPKPESEVVALNDELNETYQSVPSIFRYRSIGTSLSDPIYLVTTRKCIELMYQKCRCVLHRQHVTAGRQESAWICYEAATTMTRHFLELYPEWKPGGQFYEDRWLLGSITWNDFLLGVMVLALVLCQYRKSNVPELGAEQVDRLLETLRECKEVCIERLDESVGARRTNRLLDTLFLQLEKEPMAEEPASGTAGFPEAQKNGIVSELPLQDLAMQDASIAPDAFEAFYDPWSNVFDTTEWSFLGDCLNSNFDV